MVFEYTGREHSFWSITSTDSQILGKLGNLNKKERQRGQGWSPTPSPRASWSGLRRTRRRGTVSWSGRTGTWRCCSTRWTRARGRGRTCSRRWTCSSTGSTKCQTCLTSPGWAWPRFWNQALEDCSYFLRCSLFPQEIFVFFTHFHVELQCRFIAYEKSLKTQHHIWSKTSPHENR